MGVTKASFQVVGKDEELNDLLNKMDSGILSCCAHSLSDNIGHPSGPEALEGSRLINYLLLIFRQQPSTHQTHYSINVDSSVWAIQMHYFMSLLNSDT